MKRGYLWLDWVELGSRGWLIDETGAGLDEDDQPERCCESDYAHLDRTTLHLLAAGCRRFMARVFDDLRAAGLLYADQFVWEVMPIGDMPITAGSAGSSSVYNIRLTQHVVTKMRAA